jgi:MoaA/NifB/PqqE/SkfB family radical SAM enzyme
MNSVYQALKEDQEVILGKKGIDFTYVTNGVNFTVNETHGAILKDFGFPDPGHYFPRTLKDLIKKKEHKFDTIMAQVSANDPQHVILIGDNGESDPKVYDKITKAIGARALKKGKQVKVSVYIHMVYTPKNKKTLDLFPGQQAFYNAGDLAILMNRDGLLSADKKSAIVKDVLIKVRNESKFKVYGPLVYPYFKTRNMGLLGIKLSCLSTYQ